MKSKGKDLAAHEQDRFLLADQKTHTQQVGIITSSGGKHIPNDQAPILDTLETIVSTPIKQGSSGGSKEKQKWIRKSGNKALTVYLSSKLRTYAKDQLKISQRHRKQDWLPWIKRYSVSMFCCHRVEQTGSKLQSRYCRSKWCTVCARNRGGRLVDLYGKEFEGLKDLNHVVLTIRNMPGNELPSALDRMNLTWRKIYKIMYKQGIKPQGGRSIEITHNSQSGYYHPHYHVLISGEANAKMLKSLWLKNYKGLAEEWCQNVTQVDPGDQKKAPLELIKYTVKPLVDGEILEAEVLHTINQATFGRQMFSPFGIKKVKLQEREPPEIEISKADWIAPKTTVYNWDQYHKEWIDPTGLRLVKWSNNTVDDILRGVKPTKKPKKKKRSTE